MGGKETEIVCIVQKMYLGNLVGEDVDGVGVGERYEVEEGFALR